MLQLRGSERLDRHRTTPSPLTCDPQFQPGLRVAVEPKWSLRGRNKVNSMCEMNRTPTVSQRLFCRLRTI
jgi:hypothetical protein